MINVSCDVPQRVDPFQSLSLHVAGSVLRMFQQTVGDEIFRAGLNRLLVEK